MIDETRPLAALLAAVPTPRGAHVVAPAVAAPPLIAGLASAGDGPIVAVVATSNDAEALEAALGAYLDPATVARFPSWETLPHERLSPRADTVAQRVSTLRRLVHPEEAARESGLTPLAVVVAPLRAVLQPLVPGLADLSPVRLVVGERVDLTELAAALAGAAYTRVDMVERRGEFAVRGGIVDVFAPTDPHPVRIEFFGDEVESLRSFSIADQRSLAPVPVLWAPPCRELLLTPDVRARAAALASQAPGAADILTRIADGHAMEGMESLIPALVDHLDILPDVLPANTRFVAVEPERLVRRAEDLPRTAAEFLSAAWVSATAGADAPLDVSDGSFAALADIAERAAERGLTWSTIGPFGSGEDLGFAVLDDHRGRLEAGLKDVGKHLADGWRVVITAAGTGSAARLAEQCAQASVPARVVASVGPMLREQRPTPWPRSCPTSQAAGTRLPGAKLLVINEADLTGRAANAAGPKVTVPTKRRSVVDPLQLRPGDFVVHETHGVGRFVELTQRTVRGIEREYLVIEYAPSKRGGPGDRLSVPTDQLDLVTKYVGGETPSVSRMGGADWAKTKGRARKAVRGDRRRADPPLQRADGDARSRVWARYPVAARARGGVRLRRDARSAQHHRRGQGGHGEADPHGPAHLRRRGLWQDGGRRARRVQGDPRRHPGGAAVPNDAPGKAAR